MRDSTSAHSDLGTEGPTTRGVKVGISTHGGLVYLHLTVSLCEGSPVVLSAQPFLAIFRKELYTDTESHRITAK